jgi:PhzF family phenazine biosynthesis protein
MGLEVVTVDAFTNVPFAGNPAAVCILPEGGAEDAWMQSVAMEMNLSETAFLRHRAGDGARERLASFDLRWFTPLVEVDLCGHATLASAHLLWEDGHATPRQQLRFHTRSGVLKADRRERDGEVWIEMSFPSLPEKPYKGPTEILNRALGVKPDYVGTYGDDHLAVLESEDAVRRLSPDLALLKTLPVRGVAVTSLPDASTLAKGYDFVSRFFGPRVGVNEDPVTGSAHCGLGPLWAKRLGKTDVTGFQASARGGTVRVKTQGKRVLLGGQAVTVLRGRLESLNGPSSPDRRHHSR